MTVYVDDAKIPYRRMLMCHMVADSVCELHVFAGRIGLRADWFHRGHYNCCQDKRREAIAFGAQPITQRQAVELRRKLEAA